MLNERLVAEDNAIKYFFELLLTCDTIPIGDNNDKTIKTIKDSKKLGAIIGLIDLDKNPPKVLKKFSKIEEHERFIIYKMPNSERYIIAIRPPFEDWIYMLCDEKEFEIEKYFKNPGHFKEVSKNIHSKKTEYRTYKDCLNNIIQKPTSKTSFEKLLKEKIEEILK